MTELGEKYMQRALRLARRGLGYVEPNPVVGAVIVKSGVIIGEGWHRRFGGPHAEINALEDCRKQGADPTGATMYVSLEPCCHYGKTPPCTDAIIKAGIGKVVVATVDPSENVNGRGINQLRQAGIDVCVGICEQQARLLNAPFIKYATTGQSWVVLKWAQSIDGKLAWKEPDDQHRWISSEKSRADVQKLRRRSQAILVGINTVLADDPLLTVRSRGNKKLLRIVLDNQLRIPLDCQLLKTADEGPVVIVTTEAAIDKNPRKVEQITSAGTELFGYSEKHSSNLRFILELLGRYNVAQLLVEGGPTVIGSFLKEGLADEIYVYIAPRILAGKAGASICAALDTIAGHFELHNVDIRRFGDDVRINGLTDKGLAVVKG